MKDKLNVVLVAVLLFGISTSSSESVFANYEYSLPYNRITKWKLTKPLIFLGEKDVLKIIFGGIRLQIDMFNTPQKKYEIIAWQGDRLYYSEDKFVRLKEVTLDPDSWDSLGYSVQSKLNWWFARNILEIENIMESELRKSIERKYKDYRGVEKVALDCIVKGTCNMKKVMEQVSKAVSAYSVSKSRLETHTEFSMFNDVYYFLVYQWSIRSIGKAKPAKIKVVLTSDRKKLLNRLVEAQDNYIFMMKVLSR